MGKKKDDQNWPEMERRSHPRVASDLAGHVVTAPPDEPIVVRAKNISCSGIYCHINRYIPPFQKVNLAVIVPLEEKGKIHSEIIKLSGVTVRVEPEEEDEDVLDYHVAIFFEKVSDKDREVIGKFISQRQAGPIT